jgi:[ribosomal protein S18]-alanine N-acetyltransferase
MDLEDIPQVVEVDRESYSLPWPANAYRREILHNRNARYLVLRRISSNGVESPPAVTEQKPWLPPFLRWPRANDDRSEKAGHIVGYAGMWLMIDEAHVTTIALRNEWRGKGLGELLLVSLISISQDMGASRMTLEVRVSNVTAQNLYKKYGFHEEGLRRRYYSDNNEDAYIMTTSDMHERSFRDQIESLAETLQHRIHEIDERIHAPALGLLYDVAGASRIE